MTYLTSGKFLETFGAFLIAYVGIRAGIIEALIERPIYRRRGGANEPRTSADSSVESLRAALEIVLARRRRLFGFYEAILVAAGTSLVAIGCLLYFIGLLSER